MNPSLTKEQKKGVELVGRDICVTAGAGSGKTRVLVERFVHLVTAKKVPIQEILTITFTEKAASEMKLRIAERFQSKGLERERQDIEFAHLSTIDSFCARLLRENALEAGVDPEFAVLEEYEAWYILRNLAETLLSEWGASNLQGFHPLLEGLHCQNLTEATIKLLSKIRSTGLTPKDIPIKATSHQEIKTVQERVSLCLEEINSRRGRLPDSTKLAEMLDRIFHKLKPLTILSPDRLTQNHIEDLSHLEIRLTVPEPIKSPLQRLREELVPKFHGILSEKEALRVKEALREFLAELLKRYEEEKRKRRALDFYDLEEKVIRLLRNSSLVREELRERFKYILVDEYQDTNNLQKTLLDLLRGDDNLFVVGDAQQSIYGFRDADLEVFLQHKEETIKRKGEVIRLDKNFRSRPEILSFVNLVFKNLWGGSGPVEGSKLLAAASFGKKEAPSVELIFARGKDVEEARRQEAALLSWRIQEIVEKKSLKTTRLDGNEPLRPISYGDIAILLRSTGDIKLLERALSDLGIPFFVARGRGLYNTREISDLINLLKVVENPLDEVALAAVLRSPFVGVDDQCLFWLAYYRKARPQGIIYSLREADKITEIRPSHRDRLKRFAEQLEEFRALKGRVPVGTFIRTILDKTHFDTKVLALPSGRQRYANLRKIVELARAFEKKGVLELPEFFHVLSDLRLREIRESEASIDIEKSDVVKLMTIHAAKGLEFPVVAVVDIARAMPNTTGDIIFSKKVGLGLKLINPLTQKPIITHGYGQIVEDLRQKESRELERVFYVALTRAQEHLLLGASLGPRTEGEWLRAVAENLNLSLESESMPEILSFGNEGYQIKIITNKPTPHEVSPSFCALSQKEKQKIRMGEKLAFSAGVSPINKKILSYVRPASNPATQGDYIYSATEILSFQVCPRRYYFKYRLGLPSLTAPLSHQKEGDEIGKGILGDIAHRVLERYRPSSNKLRLQEIIIQAFGEYLAEEADQEQVATIKRWVEDFYSSPLGQEVRVAKEVEREIPFIFAYRGNPIRGKIDLLFSPEGQGWHLVDFKSTDMLEGYQFQMQLYSLAVEAVYGRMPLEAVLFFLSSRTALPVDISPKAMGVFEKRLEGFFRAREGETYPIKRGPYCLWCDYQQYCNKG